MFSSDPHPTDYTTHITQEHVHCPINLSTKIVIFEVQKTGAPGVTCKLQNPHRQHWSRDCSSSVVDQLCHGAGCNSPSTMSYQISPAQGRGILTSCCPTEYSLHRYIMVRHGVVFPLYDPVCKYIYLSCWELMRGRNRNVS